MSGDDALVGRPPADKTSFGFTNIYHRDGKNWNATKSFTTFQVPIDLGSYEGCTSIAISGDLVVVGEPSENRGQGIVQIFRRGADGWDSTTLKDDAGAMYDNFGCAVAIADGKILITAPNKNSIGQGFVFNYNGTGWQLESQLIPSGAGFFAGVGASGAMDHGIAVMGAPNRGSAFVFKQSGSTWIQFKEITAGIPDPKDPNAPAPGDKFGAAIAISNGTVAVGAPEHMSGSGAVYLFGSAALSLEQKLTLSSNHYFGGAIAIDGNRLAVGRLGDDAVDLFGRVDGDWFKFGIANGEAMTKFGASVAVSGSYVVIGAPEESGGRAYILQDDTIFRSGLQ